MFIKFILVVVLLAGCAAEQPAPLAHGHCTVTAYAANRPSRYSCRWKSELWDCHKAHPLLTGELLWECDRIGAQ